MHEAMGRVNGGAVKAKDGRMRKVYALVDARRSESSSTIRYGRHCRRASIGATAVSL